MNKNVLLICVTAIVITVVGMGAWIVAMGYDADRALGWIGTNIGPVILNLGILLLTKRVKDDTHAVRRRTNGVLDQLFGRVRTLERRAGVNPPVPDAAPAVTPEDGRPPPPG